MSPSKRKLTIQELKMKNLEDEFYGRTENGIADMEVIPAPKPKKKKKTTSRMLSTNTSQKQQTSFAENLKCILEKKSDP